MKNNSAKKYDDIDQSKPIKLAKPCVIISIDEYENIMEELDIARSKTLPKKLAEALKRYDKGHSVSLNDLEKSLGKIRRRR